MFAERLNPTPASLNISVDEVAWKKHHRYLTNVIDVDKKVEEDCKYLPKVQDREYHTLACGESHEGCNPKTCPEYEKFEKIEKKMKKVKFNYCALNG